MRKGCIGEKGMINEAITELVESKGKEREKVGGRGSEA